ncbi:serine/threonine protein kinase [Paramagnetospirillum kuznetsovii]|uniref:Serine/threonine protein kinase n=1 Tax=Paramagnetospirillum kuznetsovii TaxID=2053833 RepID=A0A364NTF4_9PROT|nr:protein kinase family protein [Paramagnetospirillum kuznetsovii]RAU20354.1 serine/threonine protein kinase [Paramagnetospirillum kuznetsovii]
MPLPLINDYKTAVANANGRFATLDVRPHLDARRSPVFLAGNFAGVFKMVTREGENLAVKCFTREVSDLPRRYAAVAKFCMTAQCPYVVPLQFLPAEVFVTSSVAPHADYAVVTMPWVEGRGLGTIVQILCLRENATALAGLTRAWSRLCLDLLRRGVAHGDLKHDNVLVGQDGALKLIDYDSMYLPELRGLPSTMLGGVNFQHPRREVRHFDATIDHFSMLVILLSLRALTFQPDLLKRHHNGENLVLTKSDFTRPDSSDLLRQWAASPDFHVRDWAGHLTKAAKAPGIGISNLEAILKSAAKIDAAPAKPPAKGLFSFFS